MGYGPNAFYSILFPFADETPMPTTTTTNEGGSMAAKRTASMEKSRCKVSEAEHFVRVARRLPVVTVGREIDNALKCMPMCR